MSKTPSQRPLSGALSSEAWAPSADMATLRQRAAFLRQLRAFFQQREVLEVETPVLSHAANTSPHLESFQTGYTGPGAVSGQPLYLHTSPEFPMKRLLAAGSGPIFQICKVFRNGEQGPRHNPEFSMLEWYRPGWRYHQLMDELDELMQFVCATPVSKRLTYAEAFQRCLQLDVHRAGLADLQAAAARRGFDVAAWQHEQDVDVWRDLLMSHYVEPQLGREAPTIIYDFPASQAALAQIRSGDVEVAERFELYWQGVELANGYQELTDADEQQARFEGEQQWRQQQQLPVVPMDAALVAALRQGLGVCAGVALGVDRLFMLASGKQTVREVLSFEFDRC